MKLANHNRPMHAGVLLAVMLFSATTTASVSAEEFSSEPYTMAVIIDKAHGRAVTRGKYERAIEEITHSNTRKPKAFPQHNNLCVAYLKITDIDNATEACDAALTQIQKRKEPRASNARAKTPARRAYEADLAIARMNRGVLLAVKGDTDLAREEFEAALELDSRYSKIVAGNLNRLQSEF